MRELKVIWRNYRMEYISFGEFVGQCISVILERFFNFMNGRFGKKRLKDPYRMYWQIVVWGLFLYLVMRFIVFPLFEIWGTVVACMNYVIWG